MMTSCFDIVCGHSSAISRSWNLFEQILHKFQSHLRPALTGSPFMISCGERTLVRREHHQCPCPWKNGCWPERSVAQSCTPHAPPTPTTGWSNAAVWGLFFFSWRSYPFFTFPFHNNTQMRKSHGCLRRRPRPHSQSLRSSGPLRPAARRGMILISVRK